MVRDPLKSDGCGNNGQIMKVGLLIGDNGLNKDD